MNDVRAIHDRLLGAYGQQQWWPADTPFEVIVGAVLVQRTAWTNARLAIESLNAASYLRCDRLAAAGIDELQALIRPAGFYRVKARRLRSIARAIRDAGGMDALAAIDTAGLRQLLLGVHGVGAETADSILLYAFERPVAVVDAYYRRIWARLHGEHTALSSALDPTLKRLAEAALASSNDLNELHALLVEHGKRHCRSRPQCSGCPLADSCMTCTGSMV